MNKFIFILFIVGITVYNITPSVAAGNGSQTYSQHCALCHGRSGQSTLAHVPNLTNNQILRQSNSKLFNRIKRGNNGCPSFSGILGDREILELITQLRKLGR